jgi:hypothetical protein
MRSDARKNSYWGCDDKRGVRTRDEGNSILTVDLSGNTAGLQELFQSIVWRFLGDDHIVYVRLAQAGGSDADEFALLLKLFD